MAADDRQHDDRHDRRDLQSINVREAPEDDPGELMHALPHAREIGMRLHRAVGGRSLLSVSYAEKLVGDPESGVLHGGVITALLDTACGSAVMSMPQTLLGTATRSPHRLHAPGHGRRDGLRCRRVLPHDPLDRLCARGRLSRRPGRPDRLGRRRLHAGKAEGVSRLNAQARLEAQRDAALEALTDVVPYNRFIGVRFDRLGDELTARMPYKEALIGNPFLPAIHGGVTGAFLEITALMQLAWDQVWALMEEGGEAAAAVLDRRFPPMPKTIDITIDYLRSGRPRETFARASVQKSGRRVANLHVEAWQDTRTKPIALLRGNFLMPPPAG